MTMPVVICCTDASVALLPVGGLPLGLRHIKELYKRGVRVFYLCGLSALRPALQQARLPDDALVHHVVSDGEPLARHLQRLLDASDDVLLVRGDCLIDPRLLTELLTRTPPHWLRAPGMGPPALPAAARLSRSQRHVWATDGALQWLSSSPELVPETLDDYSPTHRGPVPFYVQVVSSAAAATSATHTLIRAAQKRALDWPALLLHPLFENRLVFWLCRTRITPNQVTLLTTVLGALVAAMFLHGWLRLGIVLAHVVGVLDGVDGKLARTKVQTSRLGECEHVLDFLVEHAWYLTITMFLVTSTQHAQLWWVGAGLMLSGLLDNLLYGAGHLLFHRQLDEMAPFDYRFRLIAGRRNIYVWMLGLGFWVGVPVQSLVAALSWALVTVVVHGVRLVYHARQRPRRMASLPA